MKLKLHSPLKLGVAVVIIGMLFRLQQWAYGNQLLVTGIVLMILGYGYDLWRKEKRGFIDFIKMGLVVLMAIGYVANLLHYATPPLLEEISSYAFWAFLLVVGWELLTKGKEGSSQKTAAVVFGICTLLIVAGVVFQVQHWSGGTYLIIGGTILAALWVFLSPYLEKEE